ncbi:MAG: Mur ligase family protein [Candidatus Nanohaloarchaea archaeon]|nr:Mur ligase family protein [Candidatus Nanohaloarchaea archaeon]
MTHELQHFLKQRHNLESVTSVDSIQPAVETMDAIGNPQDNFPAFHVAGTNGKGSTCTFIARVLEQAGYTVGLYTGPTARGYLYEFQIDGEPIPEQTFLDLADEIDAVADPSMYEMTTAIAFLHFSRQDIDVAVIETGIGGRLDASNVLSAENCVITPIAKDHTELLGDTRESIAAEKAAIIDEGANVVTNVADDVMHVFHDRIDEVGATHVPLREPVNLEHEGLRQTAAYRGERLQTQLLAGYQEENINTALTALDAADFTYTRDDVRETLRTFTYPGRMELAAENPDTVLDGAHNPAGIEAQLATIESFDRDIIAVFSVMGDKKWEEMLEKLSPAVDELILTEASKDRAASPEELAESFEDASIIEEPAAAVHAARQRAGENSIVLVTGSLYLCRDVRPEL